MNSKLFAMTLHLLLIPGIIFKIFAIVSFINSCH